METTYAGNPALAKALCKGMQLEGGQSVSELAAWTMVVSAVYNLDITKTRE